MSFLCPYSFLSQEVFDSISDYVITGRQLYGKTVAVTVSDLQIVGFPLCIENEKVREVYWSRWSWNFFGPCRCDT
jgi:hypothetical protein